MTDTRWTAGAAGAESDEPEVVTGHDEATEQVPCDAAAAEVDEQVVEDRKPLRAPRGATVLIQERRSTEFAEHALLKYRLPARCFQPRARARRRRR